MAEGTDVIGAVSESCWRRPAWSMAFLVVATTLLLPFASWSADSVRLGGLLIERPWARASIGTSRPAAAYFTVENNSGEADSLIGVSSPVAGTAMIHTATEENGVVHMRAAGPLEIPPGKLEMRPGRMHVMLMQLREPLIEGETLPLEVTFERAGRVTVQAPVLGLGAMGPQ